MSKLLNVGGQAVIEGVMMKSPHYVAVAVRKPNKQIALKVERSNSVTEKFKFLKMPFFRGIVMLFEMLSLGIKALNFSANESMDESEDENEKNQTKDDHAKGQLSSIAIFFTILISLGFAILLFVLTPYALTSLLNIHEETSPILFNFVDGIIKLALFVLYIFLISRMEDIKRVFQYHGAEHKAVNCYEHKKKLTVENTQKFTTLNPRCGTSFILFVILIGVIVFSFVPVVVDALFPQVATFSFMGKRAVFFFTRIIFMLPLAGISYEILKISALYQKNIIFKIISLPGLAVQKMTTSEPTDDQVEVAIKSLEAVLDMETKTHGYEPVELT